MSISDKMAIIVLCVIGFWFALELSKFAIIALYWFMMWMAGMLYERTE